MISADTKVYGIIGDPVSHSLSPVLQNTLAKEMNIDMSYLAFYVTENIKDAIKGAFALNIKGFNVTIPYKKDMLDIVTEIDDRARKIGAINTLTKSEKGYKGYNTDIIGLGMSLHNNNLSVKDKDIIILGAGGAAKAVLYLAIEEGAKSITIINRNISKAEQLKVEVGIEHILVISLDDLKSDIDLLSKNNYFVFQTTNVGMHPNIEDCIIKDESFYKKCDSGIDLIYTPFETSFIKKMKSNGKSCINGLDKLILQGVASFEIWNNIKVDKDIIEKVKVLLTEKLRERMQ